MGSIYLSILLLRALNFARSLSLSLYVSLHLVALSHYFHASLSDQPLPLLPYSLLFSSVYVSPPPVLSCLLNSHQGSRSQKTPRRWYRFGATTPDAAALSRPLLTSYGAPQLQVGLSEWSDELRIGGKTQETGRFEVRAAAATTPSLSSGGGGGVSGGSSGSSRGGIGAYSLGVDIQQAPGKFWR